MSSQPSVFRQATALAHRGPCPLALSRRLERVIRLLVCLLGAIAAGCATLGQSEQPLVPTRYQTRTGPYAVYSGFALAADAAPVRHLQSLDRQLESTLGMRVDPGEHPIEVYILSDRQAFTHFLKFYYPDLPPRRAFFLAQGPRRVVYTFQGERLDEDLRHEATHALLHVAIADIPLWLDEGLAEYFESPDEQGGVNPEHLNRLPQDRADGWSPNLARLEQLKDVRQMSPRDYRESWAWVHYLLNGPPAGRTALLSYLNDLRTGRDVTPLSQRLDEESDSPPRLLAHLERLREQPIATTATSDATVRLQNPPAEPPAPAKRRSLLSRFLGMFGF